MVIAKSYKTTLFTTAPVITWNLTVLTVFCVITVSFPPIPCTRNGNLNSRQRLHRFQQVCTSSRHPVGVNYCFGDKWMAKQVSHDGRSITKFFSKASHLPGLKIIALCFASRWNSRTFTAKRVEQMHTLYKTRCFLIFSSTHRAVSNMSFSLGVFLNNSCTIN
jgi:hypothetical protein